MFVLLLREDFELSLSLSVLFSVELLLLIFAWES